jgi:hypothetical protein
MLRTGFIAFAAVGMFAASTVSIASAAAKCTSIGARCAVEVGGQCDPQTGRWTYGLRGVGGSNKGGAFDACVSRELQRARRK